MSLDFITRKRATITVNVANRPRRFILRAHAVVAHLELLEVQEEARRQALTESKAAGTSRAAAVRAEARASITVATHLLQEPADGGQPLTEAEGWLLGLEDPLRVITLQASLTNIEQALGQPQRGKAPPGMAELVGDWLDIATTISRAKLSPEPHTPLNEWSMGQVVETYHRACRELWRETAMQVRCAGGDPGKEPDFTPRKRKAKTDNSADVISTLKSWKQSGRG